MSCELAQALADADDQRCSLVQFEDALLARSADDDQGAARWLYAWAYDALRVRGDRLATRVTTAALTQRFTSLTPPVDVAMHATRIRRRKHPTVIGPSSTSTRS